MLTILKVYLNPTFQRKCKWMFINVIIIKLLIFCLLLIRLSPVPDPAKSVGSLRFRIHNTGKRFSRLGIFYYSISTTISWRYLTKLQYLYCAGNLLWHTWPERYLHLFIFFCESGQGRSKPLFSARSAVQWTEKALLRNSVYITK
jgi:hypothetical protein